LLYIFHTGCNKIELSNPILIIYKMTTLQRFHFTDHPKYEICIDEAGRGCLFGKVYIACVILPRKEEDFPCENIKDSKKFSSKKKLNDVSNVIKENALYWNVVSMDETIIDQINILKAVMRGMHQCLHSAIDFIKSHDPNVSYGDICALIDGNYFQPYCHIDNESNALVPIEYYTFEKGDGRYVGIASAGILAKTSRDAYVLEECAKYPLLAERYKLDTNYGYGTKHHLEGLKEHGMSPWHRKTYGLCKTLNVNWDSNSS
jgi:ribonuclease HII